MDFVLTFPTKFADGANSLDELLSNPPTVAHEAQVCTLDEMLGTDWATDAHFVSYFLKDPDGDLYARPVRGATFKAAARVNKPALHSIESAGWSLVAWGAVLDFDLKDNRPAEEIEAEGKGWTQDRLEWFAELCNDIRAKMEAKGLPIHTIYRTNHGARFIHRYDQLLPVEDHEQVLEGLRKLYLASNIKMDEACGDWTRLMRAPRVIRDDNPTWTPEWFASFSDDDAWTITSLAPRSDRPKGANKAHVPDYKGDRLDPDKCHDLFYEQSNGGKGAQKQTDLCKKLKAKLKRIGNDALVEALTDGTPYPFEIGAVNNDMTHVVGSMSGRLYSEDYMQDPGGPEIIYALLLPGAEELQDEKNDWPSILWSLCCRMWTGEAAQAKAVEIEQEEKLEKEKSKLDALLDNLRKLYPSTSIDLAWTSQHAIAKKGSECLVMQSDGTYSAIPTEVETLPNAVRALDMEFLIPLEEMRGNQVVLLSGRDLIKRFGFSLSGIEYSLGAEGAVLRDEGFGQVLVLPLPSVRDLNALPPEQFAEIMEYLRAALPPEQIEHFLDALAAFPQETQRTAAISIVGPRSAGKDMTGEAMTDLFGRAATTDSIVGDFPEDLLLTGLLWINESHGQDSRGVSKFSSGFRRLTGGTRHVVSRKHRSNVQVERAYRVLFTANDDNLLLSLIGDDSDAGYEDGLEATSERIARFTFTPGATEWLQSRGGMSYTGKPGAEWVGGDPNNGGMRLARFFLDLSRMAQDGRRPITNPDPRGRFLVRGTDLATEGRDLLVGRGLTPHVLEVVAHLAGQGRPDGVLVEGALVLVSSTNVADYINERQRRGKRVTANSVARCLKPLLAYDDPVRRNGLRCWQLDRQLLCEDLERLGRELPTNLRAVDDQGAA